jgi:hypothetical protein
MKKVLFIVIAIGLYSQVFAQKSQKISFDISELGLNTSKIVSVNIDKIKKIDLENLVLQNSKSEQIPYQIFEGKIYWQITKSNIEDKSLEFEFKKGKKIDFDAIKIKKDEGSLLMSYKENKLLQYNFETVYPPNGVDTAYKRSGFIHPLWSPNNKVLTRIQAPDHYHHYGIWNPWTHVLFEKDTVDFWNLKDRKGTVRFANFVSQTSGPVFSEYVVKHEHVAFKKDGSEKVAINEIQKVRIQKPSESYYLMDIEINLSCATNSPVKILEYRYAGMGWRTTEKWDNKNSEVLSSEGKTRKNADGTSARWCIVQGQIDDDYAGAAMLSSPENYNHPEPLRIWPEDMYKRGDMFAMFAPTKNKDWSLEPGKTYTLKYRWVVFKDKMTAEKIENEWKSYVININSLP